jgi:hypothetical protein
VPRATFDLDILIEPTLDNARRLLEAFLESGIGTASLTTAEQLLDNEITVFKDIARIDVQTSTPGVTFEEVWDRKIAMNFQDQEFYILSKEDLIKSKRASGRDVDLEDIRLIENRDDA